MSFGDRESPSDISFELICDFTREDLAMGCTSSHAIMFVASARVRKLLTQMKCLENVLSIQMITATHSEVLADIFAF